MQSYKLNRLIIVVTVFMTCSLGNAQVVINEYSCSNLKSIPDNNEKYEDWIELYNLGNSPVNVSGYHLSDKKNKPGKWKIPNTDKAIIPAKGYLLIWASKRDTVIGSDFHTNFTLKQTKEKREYVILSDPSENVVDSNKLVITQLSHSVGRVSDGSGNWGIYQVPTPGKSNNSSTAYTYADKPSFGISPGFYSSSVNITVTANLNTGDTIRYTTDGTVPKRMSSAYTGPITIDKTTILKAKVFSSNQNVLPGQLEYGTYFINENHSLVVISVSADSLTELVNDVGGDTSGTIDSDNQTLADLLRPHGTFEYYGKDKLLKSKSMGEFNKHGKDSWICDQRALDFIARDEMGDNHAIKEKIFPNYKRKSFQRLILRSSGDDNYPCGHKPDNKGSAHMRDGYIHNLVKRSDLHLDVRSSTRTILYLNGEYWGVYEIRENPDDHDFCKYNYNQGKYDIQYLLTWGDTKAKYGGDKALSDWEELKNFILTNDMSDNNKYEYVKSKLNVKSLVDYVLVNSFTVCKDWLNYNVGWWRGLDPKGNHKKWGYILWDNDATFGFYINYTGIPDTSAKAKLCDPETLTDEMVDVNGHIRILNKLKKNEEFYNYYVNRYIDLMNTTFSCDSMLNYLDEYKAIIEPEMKRHAKRWSGTYEEWNKNVNELRSFIQERCTAVQSTMNSCYNLNGPYSLTLSVNPVKSATIKMNSLQIDTLPWKGIAYNGVETKLKVKPNKKNDVFVGWSAGSSAFKESKTNKKVRVTITSNDTIVAKLLTSASSINNVTGNSSLTVYPTVTNRYINISCNINMKSDLRIEIYDVTGRKLLDRSYPVATGKQHMQLDLSATAIENGTYLMQLSTEGQKQTAKFILNK